MTLQLRYAAHSEVGLIRNNNQDSGYASPHLLVVADGMGGAAAGDLASAVAIETMRKIEGPTTGEEMLDVLASAIHEANAKIADLVESDSSLEGMGTTVTGAMFDGVQLGLAHIGDSRGYLYRDSHLERLTHDHTWVQSLVDDGKISEDEAALHPHRSLLLKVLNGQATNDPDLTMVPVHAGDRLMFCSDGVCGLIDDNVIETALQLPDPNDAVERLVDKSLREGGIDNITVIVADVVESRGSDGVVVLGAASQQPIRRPGAPRRQLPEDDTEEETLVTSLANLEPTHDDEERYSPQPPHRRRFRRPLVGLLALLLIAVAGLGMAYAWTRTQYFVGADQDKVAIFQGLSEGLPGLSLSRVYEVQQVTVSELPPFYQEQVKANIDVPSLDSARATVAELSAAAERCANPEPTTSPRATPTPGTKPSPTPSKQPGGKPTPTPSAPATDQVEPSC
ncbi:MAG TPA: protein phosphatase 2C domain-containing protein [Propionibacteriaceae bacterium]|nr:protein phosphatase 2C domain-containing protein [Propionibacteriaceae bacterium]